MRSDSRTRLTAFLAKKFFSWKICTAKNFFFSCTYLHSSRGGRGLVLYSTTDFSVVTKHGMAALPVYVTKEGLLKDWCILKTKLETPSSKRTSDDVFAAFRPRGIAGEGYPNLRTLVQLCLTITVSSAESERQFSLLSRVKTKIRNRLENRNLRPLFLIEGEMSDELSDERAQRVLRFFAQGIPPNQLREMLRVLSGGTRKIATGA